MRVHRSLYFYLTLLGFAQPGLAGVGAKLTPRPANELVVKADLQFILAQAGLPQERIDFVRVSAQGEPVNQVTLSCPTDQRILLTITSSDAEWSSTFYLGLQKLGFLFPHPRVQVSPKADGLNALCGQTFKWDPRLKFRGFHLHTQHPNEWVHGFFMGQKQIALDMVRWLARNQQNVMSLVLLREFDSNWADQMQEPLKLAESFGILTGIDITFSSQQQKAFRLVNSSIWDWFLDLICPRRDLTEIKDGITHFASVLPFDFMMIELGMSEFSPTNPQQTLEWIAQANETLQGLGRQLFIKVHASINQNDPQWGNLNFLPKFASAEVGILPHTVMDYALDDPYTPVYDRSSFDDLRELMLSESSKRPVWYFPETSYFIAMDIDMPLLLTDYLLARSCDMDFLEDHQIEGQLDFTTGQELGYWLMDWTVALLVNRDYRGKPMIGMELLGEDLAAWQEILDFQHQYIQTRGPKTGLLGILSSSTLLDEVPWVSQSVHERVLLRDLQDHPSELAHEISLLEQASERIPNSALQKVANSELKALLGVTFLRIQHALHLRRAIALQDQNPDMDLDSDLDSDSDSESPSSIELGLAQSTRAAALGLIQGAIKKNERYPEAQIFSKHINPTSYHYGYGWSASNLHYWEREEKMISENNFSPFFMNIYDPFLILF